MKNILIQTSRLKLRELQSSDVEALLESSDSFSPEGAAAFVEAALEDQKEVARSEFLLAIELIAENKLAGCVEFRIFFEEQVAELGYWIHPAYQNKGLATELIKAFTSKALIAFNLREIQATTSIENTASILVLERSGFTRDQDAQANDPALKKNQRSAQIHFHCKRS